MSDRRHPAIQVRDEPIPADVLSKIKAARLTDEAVRFDGTISYMSEQIIKAEEIYFFPDARVHFGNIRLPWVAIVAKRIRIWTPNLLRAVITFPSIDPRRPDEHPSLGQAEKGQNGDTGQDGKNGRDGISGMVGNKGYDGLKVPTLYILTDEVLRGQGADIPPFMYYNIEVSGNPGGRGSYGQNGQKGGTGGDGGTGVSTGTVCNPSPGTGGNGGMGGAGGNGGPGGDSSNGGDVHFGGSLSAIRLLSFASISSKPGAGGGSGPPGGNGERGYWGERGARPGVCQGGTHGALGPGNPYVPQWGAPGVDGQHGRVLSAPVSVASLFT